jgi:hypothetical protein
MKTGLVFNINEVDMPESEDWKPKKAIVPKIKAGEKVHHHVSRAVKYISIVICSRIVVNNENVFEK